MEKGCAMAGRDYIGIPRDKIPWSPSIDAEKCVGCGECLEVCANGVYLLDEAAGKMNVANPNNCVVLCDKCAVFCRQEAITFPDKQETKKLVGRLLLEMQEKQHGEG